MQLVAMVLTNPVLVSGLILGDGPGDSDVVVERHCGGRESEGLGRLNKVGQSPRFVQLW